MISIYSVEFLFPMLGVIAIIAFIVAFILVCFGCHFPYDAGEGIFIITFMGWFIGVIIMVILLYLHWFVFNVALQLGG